VLVNLSPHIYCMVWVFLIPFCVLIFLKMVSVILRITLEVTYSACREV